MIYFRESAIHIHKLQEKYLPESFTALHLSIQIIHLKVMGLIPVSLIS